MHHSLKQTPWESILITHVWVSFQWILKMSSFYLLLSKESVNRKTMLDCIYHSNIMLPKSCHVTHKQKQRISIIWWFCLLSRYNTKLLLKLDNRIHTKQNIWEKKHRLQLIAECPLQPHCVTELIENGRNPCSILDAFIHKIAHDNIRHTLEISCITRWSKPPESPYSSLMYESPSNGFWRCLLFTSCSLRSLWIGRQCWTAFIIAALCCQNLVMLPTNKNNGSP